MQARTITYTQTRKHACTRPWAFVVQKTIKHYKRIVDDGRGGEVLSTLSLIVTIIIQNVNIVILHTDGK